MSGHPRYFEELPDGKIACKLCPNACVISAGRHGTCRVRFNREGTMDTPFSGELSSIALDPIEKKPLYHFYPGASILSVGFVGCSFHCKFCQNHTISQSTDVPTRAVSPDELVHLARREGSFGIAYTYSEPLIHIEYLMDAARAARKAGLKNVLVSNGYINPGPAADLLPLIDAANIDLKANDPAFYTSEVGGEMQEVKRFIMQAVRAIHLEVTTLIIPTKNDSETQVDEIARFLASLDPAIALHLSCYYPRYRYTLPPTEPSVVHALAEVARRRLRFVYEGNVGNQETNTYCHACRALLVRRRGYDVSVTGVTGGTCATCGEPVPFVMTEAERPLT